MKTSTAIQDTTLAMFLSSISNALSQDLDVLLSDVKKIDKGIYCFLMSNVSYLV